MAGADDIDVREEVHMSMAEYESVPISFTVDRILTRVACDVNRVGMVFAEEPVAAPYLKDYDQDAEQLGLGSRPSTWGDRWDLSNWGILAARDRGVLVGGGAVAFRTRAVDLLEGRDDVAVLWDLRVVPERRGSGVGKQLFDAAAEWSREHGASVMKIETQNVNVTACRFYARQGCTLVAVNSRAYPDLPNESQMMWVLELQ